MRPDRARGDGPPAASPPAGRTQVVELDLTLDDALTELEYQIVERELARQRMHAARQQLELARQRQQLSPTRDAVALALCNLDDTEAVRLILQPYRGNERMLIGPLLGIVDAIADELGNADELRLFLERLALHLASD